MQYTVHYTSPLGRMLLAADEQGLTGVWFEGQKYFAARLQAGHAQRETPVLAQAKRWLDGYFGGEQPGFTPPLHLEGTAFQQRVWALLCAVPYGATVTYGQLACQLARQGGGAPCAQAVGGAVGRNPVSVIVPCHRVVGANGSLTGYAGGVQRKLQLLRLEGADAQKLFVPAKGTAL